MCLLVLTNLVYPATLTVIGLVGNAYILGSPTQEVKAELQEVKRDVRAITVRQNEISVRNMSIADKLLRGCGSKKK